MELANGLAGDASLRALGPQANDMMPTVSFLGHQISAVQDRRGLSPNTEPGAPSLGTPSALTLQPLSQAAGRRIRLSAWNIFG